MDATVATTLFYPTGSSWQGLGQGSANYIFENMTTSTLDLDLQGAWIHDHPACDVWDMIFDAALFVNPAFNMYHVLDTLVLWDVLGLPGSFPQAQTTPVYFDRADVKAAIHAPPVGWEECKFEGPDVFP
ncbi:hypothetical protein EDB84DRAFT_1555790 [Lactarius hengduanensis]|nr:hypothetical protein EDB84DRAFT_1555790 [Lactarius hengduanensis]